MIQNAVLEHVMKQHNTLLSFSSGMYHCSHFLLWELFLPRPAFSTFRSAIRAPISLRRWSSNMLIHVIYISTWINKAYASLVPLSKNQSAPSQGTHGVLVCVKEKLLIVAGWLEISWTVVASSGRRVNPEWAHFVLFTALRTFDNM